MPKTEELVFFLEFQLILVKGFDRDGGCVALIQRKVGSVETSSGPSRAGEPKRFGDFVLADANGVDL